jgi:hypothetical protein
MLGGMHFNYSLFYFKLSKPGEIENHVIMQCEDVFDLKQ